MITGSVSWTDNKELHPFFCHLFQTCQGPQKRFTLIDLHLGTLFKQCTRLTLNVCKPCPLDPYFLRALCAVVLVDVKRSEPSSDLYTAKRQ
jgi:hypothetical protein